LPSTTNANGATSVRYRRTALADDAINKNKAKSWPGKAIGAFFIPYRKNSKTSDMPLSVAKIYKMQFLIVCTAHRGDLEIAGISLISRKRIIRPRLHGNQRDQINIEIFEEKYVRKTNSGLSGRSQTVIAIDDSLLVFQQGNFLA
jgi:hypothetical protein